MTLPRTAAEVLSGHVTFEIRCTGRVLLTFRQPRLQYGQGIHGFFCFHRGNQFASSALMMPMTERFAAGIRHYTGTRRLELVRFAKGQGKDQVAKEYLTGKSGGGQVLFVGVAQEKARIWRTSQRRDPVTGKRYPWLYQDAAMVNHWYFYGFDAGFGPFYVKFCGYFPFTGQVYFNGHEYAKRQCRKEGIEFTSLDNAFGTAGDAGAVQRICDGLTDQKTCRFAGKWLARLPQPFTRADEEAGYRWQLSVQQTGFSTTMAPGRPLSGRIFSGQLIRDNPGIGRPDKVNLVFGRAIRRHGKHRTPGTFRTQVITSGTGPYLYLSCKKTQVKQYLKEGRALRTETTLNQPRDLGTGKEPANLAPQLGKTPEDMSGGQVSYDLRRLRAHQIIDRIPHSRSCQVTPDGLSAALFFTRLTRRVIIPALADLAGTSPPPGTPLRQADRAYRQAVADLAAQASPGRHKE